jgi:hypothetical protein
VNEGIIDPRRGPRVLARLAVDVRGRAAAFRAETEDLGRLGCQLAVPRAAIVLPRAIEVGRELALALRAPGVRWSTPASGRVVWTRFGAAPRCGIAFSSALDPVFFDAILPAEAADASPHTARPLARDAVLWLDEPPRIPAISADELAILRCVEGGASVDQLARALGAAFHPARGALHRLLARGLLTLSPERAVPPERWREALDAAEVALGARRATPVERARPPAVQALYEEGVSHLHAGRLDLAISRFQEALAIAPWDEAIAGAARRLSPWAR